MQAGALDMLPPLDLDVGAKALEHGFVERRESSPATASRVAMAMSRPPVTERTPRRTAQ